MGIANMFEVVTTSRTYHLIADSDREMQQWVDVLTYANSSTGCERAGGRPPPN